MYENYLANPGSVPDNWRDYFDALQHVPAVDGTNAKRRAPPARSSMPSPSAPSRAAPRWWWPAAPTSNWRRKRTAVQQLIAAYRNVGAAGPTSTRSSAPSAENIPELEPSFYGFSDADQEACSTPATPSSARTSMSLRELLQRAARDLLRHHRRRVHVHHRPGARSAGGSRSWSRIRSKPNFSAEKKKHILDRLTAAEGLERFLHTKYVGQKRFSLEGGESFIASMDELIQRAGAQGRAGDRDRHGPPRPPERAGQHAGQDAQGPVRRVRPHRAGRPARRRREVPPGLQLATSPRPAARCT